jgi:hypothetical protein
MRSALRDVYDDVAAADRDAEHRFFSRVRLPTGVLKTTEPERLDDLNQLVLPLLPSGDMLELMDVAVSTGITSLEWSRQLTSAGIEHHLVCGDSLVEAEWLPLPGVGDVLLDRDRRDLLFVELFGRPVDPSGGSKKAAVAVCAIRATVWLGRLLRMAFRRVDLVSPAVRACPAVSVIQDDIFVRRPELAARFHALRAANILNRAYFDDEQLRAGIRTLRERIRPGGLLIVCRTHDDGTNHGSIVQLADAGWIVRARIGDGSEIEELLAADGPGDIREDEYQENEGRHDRE